MIRLLFVLSACALLTSGCIFSKKNAPKENPAIAGENEAIFRQRWIDKRTNEIVAQGKSAAAAREQATAEFRAQFGFNEPGAKKK